MLNILYEPKDQQYRKLLDFCLKYCTKIIVVIQDKVKLVDNFNNIIKILEPFLIKKYRSSEWPGTKLINSKATIYLFQYNNEVNKILKKYTKSLFEWKQPNFPEDICFLDENENAILTTIAHESDAFVKANKDIENSFRHFFNEQNFLYEDIQ